MSERKDYDTIVSAVYANPWFSFLGSVRYGDLHETVKDFIVSQIGCHGHAFVDALLPEYDIELTTRHCLDTWSKQCEERGDEDPIIYLLSIMARINLDASDFMESLASLIKTAGIRLEAAAETTCCSELSLSGRLALCHFLSPCVMHISSHLGLERAMIYKIDDMLPNLKGVRLFLRQISSRTIGDILTALDSNGCPSTVTAIRLLSGRTTLDWYLCEETRVLSLPAACLREMAEIVKDDIAIAFSGNPKVPGHVEEMISAGASAYKIIVAWAIATDPTIATFIYAMLMGVLKPVSVNVASSTALSRYVSDHNRRAAEWSNQLESDLDYDGTPKVPRENDYARYAYLPIDLRASLSDSILWPDRLKAALGVHDNPCSIDVALEQWSQSTGGYLSDLAQALRASGHGGVAAKIIEPIKSSQKAALNIKQLVRDLP